MRVSYLTPWNHACGIAEYSQQLVGALREFADVRVVELEPKYRTSLVEALRHRASDLRYYRELGEQLNDADVAHIQFQYPLFGGFAPWKLKFGAVMQRVRVPVVLTMHELDYRQGSGFPSTSFGYAPFDCSQGKQDRSLGAGRVQGSGTTSGFNFFQRQRYFHNASIVTWPQTKAIVVHTKAFVEPLTGLMVAPEAIHVQPMPVPELAPLPAQEEAKARLGLTGIRVLAMLGFVVARKGYETALLAMGDLPAEVRLAIVGGRNEFDRTRYFDRLRQAVSASSLSSRVVITGYLPDDRFRDWLAAADVILAPFDEMSGSSSLTLAIAAEKPIVASDLPGIVEMNEVAPCIRTFERGDPAALARTVNEVLDDRAERERLVSAARVYKSKCSARETARRTAEVYRSIAEPAAR